MDRQDGQSVGDPHQSVNKLLVPELADRAEIESVKPGVRGRENGRLRSRGGIKAFWLLVRPFQPAIPGRLIGYKTA